MTEVLGEAQWANHLLYKNEDLSSKPSTHIESKAWLQMPAIPVVEDGDRQTPGSLFTSLAQGETWLKRTSNTHSNTVRFQRPPMASASHRWAGLHIVIHMQQTYQQKTPSFTKGVGQLEFSPNADKNIKQHTHFLCHYNTIYQFHSSLYPREMKICYTNNHSSTVHCGFIYNIPKLKTA